MRLEVDINYNRIVMIDTQSQFLQKLAKLVETLGLVQLVALTDVERASKTGYLDLIADNPKTLLIIDLDSLDANAIDVLKNTITSTANGEITILGLFDKWSESIKKLTDLNFKLERRPKWPKNGHTKTTFKFYKKVFDSPNIIGIFAGHIHKNSIEIVKGKTQIVSDDNASGAYLDIDFLPMKAKYKIV